MPDSDNDKSAAIDKVVGAFRARREQAKDEPANESAAPVDEPTPVVKLDASATAPKPKGSDSESPTRAFKVPAGVAAAAEKAVDDAASSDETAVSDDAVESDEAAASDETAASDAVAASGDTDAAVASDETSESDDGDAPSTGLVEETVVGEELSADAPETADAERAVDESAPKPAVVEESVDLAVADQEAGSEEVSADESETPEPETESGADAAPTEQIAVPAAVAAAATTKISTQKPPAAQPAAPAPAQPGPQVIAPAAEPAKKGRGKVIAALVAVLVVIVAIVIGAFYMFGDNSPESKVADAATSYQDAMNDGDLSKLREVTCGADNAYYSKVSDDEFAKAYTTQKDRNELMRFDEVNAVAIDGDTARVGVDLYNSNDPSKKIPAQITLQKVGGDWKVCKSLN